MIADIVQTGLSSWWAPALAFAAGLVSCLSPCVWPLLPGYLSFITGEQIVGEESGVDRTPLAPMLLFILGFTIVFVLLGAFASTFVRVFKGTTGQRVGGAIVITFGVLMIGYALRRGSMALYAERRPFLARVRPGVGAVPLGMAFAAGWTPCIGPVLGSILAIAASGSTARAVVLLVCYSAGLGLPFLLVGLGVTRFMGAFDWVKRRYTPIGIVSGSLMIAVGVLLFTGEFTRIVAPLAERFTLGI
ncbi:MAG TPA: cytochrome c biogenesis protein CcdA [Actinomycetota bacterium]|nr:cytochrome c biogenesis protein CcdA [Actinomycetota bacterium]